MTARVEQHTATVHVHGLALTVDVYCAVIACDHDGCGAVYVTPGDDDGPVDVATKAAAALGWTYDGGTVDGCPLHPVGGESLRAVLGGTP